MTDKEIRDCIQLLKVLNPKLATGFPKGARIPLQSLPNTRDLGALATKDGRHILPRRLLRSGNLYHMSLQDQDTLLDEYHLSTVVDFRTRMESWKNRIPFLREWSTMRSQSWMKKLLALPVPEICWKCF